MVKNNVHLTSSHIITQSRVSCIILIDGAATVIKSEATDDLTKRGAAKIFLLKILILDLLEN